MIYCPDACDRDRFSLRCFDPSQLLHLEQLRVSVLSPVNVFAKLLIDRDSQSDPAFDVAQLDKTVLPIIQVDSVVLGDAIRFIQSIFDIEELGDREGGSDKGSVGLIDLVGERDSGCGVIGSLRQALMLGEHESDNKSRQSMRFV